MSGRRRLVCRLRGHDDAVTAVVTHVGAAVLACDRCGRRALVPYRAATPPTLAQCAAQAEVAQVDKGALDLLQWSAEVGAHLAAGLLDRDQP